MNSVSVIAKRRSYPMQHGDCSLQNKHAIMLRTWQNPSCWINIPCNPSTRSLRLRSIRIWQRPAFLRIYRISPHFVLLLWVLYCRFGIRASSPIPGETVERWNHPSVNLVCHVLLQAAALQEAECVVSARRAVYAPFFFYRTPLLAHWTESLRRESLSCYAAVPGSPSSTWYNRGRLLIFTSTEERRCALCDDSLGE